MLNNLAFWVTSFVLAGIIVLVFYFQTRKQQHNLEGKTPSQQLKNQDAQTGKTNSSHAGFEHGQPSCLSESESKGQGQKKQTK